MSKHLCSHLTFKVYFEAISSAPFSGKILTNSFNVTAISLCLDLNIFYCFSEHFFFLVKLKKGQDLNPVNRISVVASGL